MKNINDRLWAKVLKGDTDDCWEWQGFRHTRTGHGQIGRGKRCEGLTYTHIVAWEFANSAKVPDGLCVRHKCDNPPCCNPNHLEIGTRADNNRDSVDRGRNSFGEHHATKLSEVSVLEIIRRGRHGAESQSKLGSEYGVSRSMVGAIILGKRWGHLASR